MPASAKNKRKSKLCARGYEAAKRKYKIYPSAYANAYAVQVCRGEKPDAKGKRYASAGYKKGKRSTPKDSALERWFAERWVNVCEWPKNTLKFPPPFPACGRAKGTRGGAKYPYCRPSVRVDRNTPKTVRELGPAKLKQMCKKKRARVQRGKQSKSPKRVQL